MSDDLIRKAKVLAAQRDTSVSALVSTLLIQAVGQGQDYDQLWAQEEEVMATGPLRVGSITWDRDDVHTR